MTQEIYALSIERSGTKARKFLDKFLPRRIAFADEYPVPECDDSPTNIFATADALMLYLDAHPLETYAIYWNTLDTDDPIRQAMLFYTSDGQLILGLAVYENKAQKLLSELIHFSGSGTGMLGNEERPPETARDFIAATATFQSKFLIT